MASISDLCKQPLIPPPPGKTSNLVNPQSFLPIGLGIAVPLLFFAWTFVGLRAMGSLKKAHRLYVDDCFSIAALLFATAAQVIILLLDKKLNHAWDISICLNYDPTIAGISISQLFLYYPSILFAKAAVWILYIRLFESIRWIRYTSWFGLVFYTLTCAAGFILACVHFTNQPHGHNDYQNNGVDMTPFLMVQSAVTLISDFVMLGLPIRPIIKLNLSLTKKLGILACFLVASVASVASFFSLVLKIAYYTHRPKVYDWTWSLDWNNVASTFEILATIILGSVPGVVSVWRNVIRNIPFVSRTLMFLGIPVHGSDEPNIKIVKFGREKIEHAEAGAVDFRMIDTNDVVDARSQDEGEDK